MQPEQSALPFNAADEETASVEQYTIKAYTEDEINAIIPKLGLIADLNTNSIIHAINKEAYDELAAIIKVKPQLLLANFMTPLELAYFLIDRKLHFRQMSDHQALAILKFLENRGLSLSIPDYHSEERVVKTDKGEYKITVYVPDDLPLKAAIDRYATGKGDSFFKFFQENFSSRLSSTQPMLLRSLIARLISEIKIRHGNGGDLYRAALKELLARLRTDLGPRKLSDILSKKTLLTTSDAAYHTFELYFDPKEQITSIIAMDLEDILSLLIEANANLANIFGPDSGARIALENNSIACLKRLAKSGVNIASGPSYRHDYYEYADLPRQYLYFILSLSKPLAAAAQVTFLWRDFSADWRRLCRSGSVLSYISRLASLSYGVGTVFGGVLQSFILLSFCFLQFMLNAMAYPIRNLALLLTCRASICRSDAIPDNEAGAFFNDWKRWKLNTRATQMTGKPDLENFVDGWRTTKVHPAHSGLFSDTKRIPSSLSTEGALTGKELETSIA